MGDLPWWSKRDDEPSLLGRGFVRHFNLALLALIGAATVVVLFAALALVSA